MIIYRKNIWLWYINYVKKFEGHKPGREKRLENDPTIFRYRISFLITVDKFQRILLLISFFYNVIFQSQKSWTNMCCIRWTCFSRGVSRGYHIIWYHIIWYHMTSYDIIWYHMSSYDIIWYHMTSYDIIWHHMTS